MAAKPKSIAKDMVISALNGRMLELIEEIDDASFPHQLGDAEKEQVSKYIQNYLRRMEKMVSGK